MCQAGHCECLREAAAAAFIENYGTFRGFVYLTINQIANYEGIVNKYEHPPSSVHSIELCSAKKRQVAKQIACTG